MIRFRFGTRLLLIVLTGLVALQLLGAAIYLLQRSRDTEAGLSLPLPDQAAALVALLERTPKESWPLVLRAANSTNLRVRILDRQEAVPAQEWYEAPVAELVRQRYSGALRERDIRVHVEPSSELFSGPLRAFSWLSPGAVEIDIGLAGGDRLAVMASGGLGLSVFGIPPGFWAAVLALVIAAATVLMLRREARPLRDLADSVDRIDPAQGDQAIQDAPGSAPEIRALIAAFNRLGQRVANLLKARMTLIGGISHDLRTYATRLRLRTEFIADEGERAKAVQDLDDMRRLLDDSLLAIETGKPDHHEELIGIADLLEREVSDRRLAGAPVMLKFEGKAREAEILGDPVSLRRLFANLTDNAIAYGGEATITASLSGDRVIVTIDDRGGGIDKALREAVFEPFVRLEESRNRNTGGAGLGLAIARKVAEAHGGSLTLGDAPGGGARAIVALPLFALPANSEVHAP
ncbi:MAG: ATP-binding protein [Methyloceanibacter sp.]